MKDYPIDIIESTKPDIGSLPGGWEPSTDLVLEKGNGRRFDYQLGSRITDIVTIIERCITDSDCGKLIGLMEQSKNIQRVSVYGKNDAPDQDGKVGSVRTTMWSPHLAEQLTGKLSKTAYDLYAYYNTPTDWWQGDRDRKYWEFVGVSPLLRFMRYEKGSQHYAHYDAGFIYPDDNYRTLLSFVIYLTTNDDGCTRFIRDGQGNLPVWDRNHDDWTRESEESEVCFKSKPIAGNILVFPHRLCHDVERYTGDGPRIIIRGDVIFRHRKK